MTNASIAVITIAIAVVLVIGLALLSYVSSLVKSAYQIRVDMRSDLDSGLKRLDEEMRQKSRWMRTEVGEDVAKMKQALERETEERLSTIQAEFQAAVRQMDTASRGDTATLHDQLAQAHHRIAALEQDLRALKDEAARRAAIGRPPPQSPSPAGKAPAKDTAPPPLALEDVPQPAEPASQKTSLDGASGTPSLNLEDPTRPRFTTENKHA